MSINAIGNGFSSFSYSKMQSRPVNTNSQQTITPSHNIEEKKVSTKKKIAIGVAIGLGLAALAGIKILSKGKINSVKLKQLAEHIDFEKSKTLEEAIEFGKKHLGIESYEGFANADLDVINWINEGLVNVSNFQKGKLKIPDIIRYIENTNSKLAAQVSCSGKYYDNILEINKNYIKNIDKHISDVLRGGFNTKGFNQETIKDILKNIEKFKNNQLTDLNDKIKLFEDISKIKTENSITPLRKLTKILENPEAKQKLIYAGILKGEEIDLAILKGFPKININHLEQYDQRMLNIVLPTLTEKSGYKLIHEGASPFRTIYHEMGHLQFKPIGKGTGDVEFFDRLGFWNGDKKAMGTAYTVSNYAATSPNEFLAEAFAEKVSGNTLTKDAQELFERIANS